MTKFEAGKSYKWYQEEYGGFKVLRRTPRTITASNDEATWRMYTIIDDNGDEWVIDNRVPRTWREAFTCSANWIKED